MYVFFFKKDYPVEDAFLNAELESREDGEVVAVDVGDAAGAWVEDVSFCVVVQVVLQPECAECFLYAINVSAASTCSCLGFAALFLSYLSFFFCALLWGYHLKLTLYPHNNAPKIFFTP